MDCACDDYCQCPCARCGIEIFSCWCDNPMPALEVRRQPSGTGYVMPWRKPKPPRPVKSLDELNMVTEHIMAVREAVEATRNAV